MKPTHPPVRIVGTPYLNTNEYGTNLSFRPACGSSIQDVVRESIALAKAHNMDCEFTFNDVTITVDAISDPKGVLSYYVRRMSAKGVDVRLPELEYPALPKTKTTEPPEPRPRIIQILILPNDSSWRGQLLGLGDDGVTYHEDNGQWKPFIPAL